VKNAKKHETLILATIVIGAGLLLGLFTTSEHVRALGINYLEGTQLEIIQSILNGQSADPWQYRVLAPFLVNIVRKLFAHFHIIHYTAASFIIFRIIQDTIILIFFYTYCRMLKLSMSYALIGMTILAWGMSYSHYDSDLQFNTFFDVIFYLLAGLCILQEKFIWIIPITLLAAFNRETSGLIPFLLLTISIFALPKGSVRKVMPIFIVAFLTYIVVFVGLRLVYGQKELYIPYGHHIGLDLLKFNLFRLATWQNLFSTLSIFPFVAIIGYHKWTLKLRVIFWTLVPIWFVIHAFGAIMSETRLFLVPQAMVFIPGALLSLAQQADLPNRTSAQLQHNG